MGLTLTRDGMYKEFEHITLSGDVLDLGGTTKAAYRELFKGWESITAANIGGERDIDCNLEKKFPIEDAKYNGVLLINTLEHVYDTKNVLSESFRVLKGGGMIVIAVPFLIPVHPSPRDHWRFTRDSLERLLKDEHFTDITIKETGDGPFAAAATMVHNALHFAILRSLVFALARVCDFVLHRLDRNGSYGIDRYPLGYVLTAKKP